METKKHQGPLCIQGWHLTAFMGHDSRTTPEDAVRYCGPEPTKPDMATWRNQQAATAVRVALQDMNQAPQWVQHTRKIAPMSTLCMSTMRAGVMNLLPITVPDDVIRFQWPGRETDPGVAIDVDMGDIPDKWFWRAQLAMAVSEVDRITLVVAGHTRSPLMFRLHADDEAEQMLFDAAGRMEKLKRAGKLTDDVKSAEFERDKDKQRKLSDDDLPLIRALVMNAEASKRLKDERDELVASLKTAVGDGGRVTFKGVNVGTWSFFDTKPQPAKPAGKGKRFTVAQSRTLAKLVMSDDFQSASKIMREE